MKKTFKEIQEENQAKEHNSNLQNIATVLRNISDHRKDINKELLRLDSMELEARRMVALVESGKELPLNELQKLYNQSSKRLG